MSTSVAISVTALLCLLRRFEEAKRALMQALEILKRYQSDEHDDVRTSYRHLAPVPEALWRHGEAKRYYQVAGSQ